MNRRELLGIGAAACVACCVPLLVIGLGAVASAGLVSALFVGFGGLAVAAVAIVALLALHRWRRRRRQRGGEAHAVPVDIEGRG